MRARFAPIDFQRHADVCVRFRRDSFVCSFGSDAEFERDGGAQNHFCLVYRPPQGPAFCFEPITQPIDAFHLPGRPGLRTLNEGEGCSLMVRWRFAQSNVKV